MLTKSEARLIHALKTRSGREKHDAFVVEGVRIVEDVLDAGIDLKLVVVSPTLVDSRRGHSLAERLRARTVVREVGEAELRGLAETETPQGVVAVARIPHRRLAEIKPAAGSIVLVLDAVQDPGNVGTLIRSADAFAALCVVALPGTVDYWNPKVVRATAGAAFRVPLVMAEVEAVWTWLDQHEFTLCGADMRGVGVSSAQLGERTALVVGNEGSGLRGGTRARMAHLLAIPMPGRAESLNVAVAAGILLYELSQRQR